MYDLIVLEWSESQKQFHSSSLKERYDKGLKAFLNKKPNGDWVTVGIFKTKEEAFSASAELYIKRGMIWNGSKYEDVDRRRN